MNYQEFVGKINEAKHYLEGSKEPLQACHGPADRIKVFERVRKEYEQQIAKMEAILPSLAKKKKIAKKESAELEAEIHELRAIRTGLDRCEPWEPAHDFYIFEDVKGKLDGYIVTKHPDPDLIPEHARLGCKWRLTDATNKGEGTLVNEQQVELSIQQQGYYSRVVGVSKG